MRGQVDRPSWWATVTARVRNERGATFAEYTPLLAVIALLVTFSLVYLGPAVADTFTDPFGGPPQGDCPSGGWTLVQDSPFKKNGIDVDVNGNGDGWYCLEDIPGNGNGNTGNYQNVKDNNSGSGNGNGNGN